MVGLRDLLAHVICRVDLDQVGQFGLSLVCQYMVHLSSGGDQSGHIDGLNLGPLISLQP